MGNTDNMKKMVLMAAASLVLAACSSTPKTNEPAELKDIEDPIKVDVVWDRSVGSSEYEFLVPAVAGSYVYAAGSDDVYKFDAETGKEIWSYQAPENISAGVGSDGTCVAFGTAKGELIVLNDDGKFMWSHYLTSEMNAVPLVGNGLVIVRTADTRITGFDAMTGEQVWRYQGQVPSLTLKTASQMKFFEDGILIGQSNGYLLFLDMNGRTRWQALVSEPKGTTEVERLVDVLGAPMVDNDLLCSTVYEGRLVCLNAADGRLRFTYNVEAMTPPAISDRAVFVANDKSEIFAFERFEGRPLWKSDDLKNRGVRAMITFGGVLAVTDSEGYIHMINPDTGEIVGRTDMSGAFVAMPQPYEYGAIFQTDDGDLAYVKVR